MSNLFFTQSASCQGIRCVAAIIKTAFSMRTMKLQYTVIHTQISSHQQPLLPRYQIHTKRYNNINITKLVSLSPERVAKYWPFYSDSILVLIRKTQTLDLTQGRVGVAPETLTDPRFLHIIL